LRNGRRLPRSALVFPKVVDCPCVAYIEVEMKNDYATQIPSHDNCNVGEGFPRTMDTNNDDGFLSL
jgi:hypothetical protein